MRKIRRLVNGLMQHTCTASCSVRVRPHARRWTASCIIYVDGLMHFFVYGIMHFNMETLMQALYTVHEHVCICTFFIEINAILIIHNINSEISYLVVAHSIFRIKFAIKIELDVVCNPVLIWRIVIFYVDGGFHYKTEENRNIQRTFLRNFSNLQWQS